jgi:hypothetical protein
MGRHRRRPLVVLPFCLLLAGCIEDRLSVDILTQIHSDGTCSRRIEYLLERVDTDHGGARVAFDEAGSPLVTLHRFPSAEPWRVEEETGEGFHRIVLDATLDSPNAFDGDYFRAQHPGAPPARNFISAYANPADGIFEYYEVFRDPLSPLAGARALARDLVGRDEEFARLVLDALGDRAGAPREDGLGQAYLEIFAEPFARDVSDLRRRPIFGPRERRDLEGILEAVEAHQADLRLAAHSLAPTVPMDDLDVAVDAAMDALGDTVLERAEDSGLPLLPGRRTIRIAFQATLVLPYPIGRSNTCASGDTAVWEFDEQELYGRGFEMMALASAP